MALITSLFNFVLLLCTVYASLCGGRTGRAGSVIFIAATILTIAATTPEAALAPMPYTLFAIDLACMLALLGLALLSDRYWPIWALGFQTVAVATHLARLLAPDIVPRAYDALVAFWSLPILLIMVIGTRKDWINEHVRGLSRISINKNIARGK